MLAYNLLWNYSLNESSCIWGKHNLYIHSGIYLLFNLNYILKFVLFLYDYTDIIYRYKQNSLSKILIDFDFIIFIYYFWENISNTQQK